MNDWKWTATGQKELTVDKIVDRGEAERFLKGLGLKVQEGVVRQILATMQRW